MQGSVCSYELHAPGIADMIQGKLMPCPPSILASVLQVTLFGQRQLPQDWRRNIFRVRQQYIWDVLSWLKTNNPKIYGDIDICAC